MEDVSWLKLYRKLLDSPIFHNEKCLKVWVWCLLKANFKPCKVLIDRNMEELKAGEFIMGSFTAKDQLNLAKNTIWFWLRFLEQQGCIGIKTTNKYTVITILKWGDYQDVGNRWETDGKQMGNRWEQYKNDKNEENEKNIIHPPPAEIPPPKSEQSKEVKHIYGEYKHVRLTDEQYEKLKADFPDLDKRIRALDEYIQNTGKKYKDHNLTIRKWAAKDLEKPENIIGSPEWMRAKGHNHPDVVMWKTKNGIKAF